MSTTPTHYKYRKANGQEPYAWLRHTLERLPLAKSVEDYEALLPWNCTPHQRPVVMRAGEKAQE
jgi:hypothetical protein